MLNKDQVIRNYPLSGRILIFFGKKQVMKYLIPSQIQSKLVF